MNFKIVYELLETEWWEDGWNSIGLYASKSLADDAKAAREERFRKNWPKTGSDKFEDAYKWIIKTKKLYI